MITGEEEQLATNNRWTNAGRVTDGGGGGYLEDLQQRGLCIGTVCVNGVNPADAFEITF